MDNHFESHFVEYLFKELLFEVTSTIQRTAQTSERSRHYAMKTLKFAQSLADHHGIIKWKPKQKSRQNCNWSGRSQNINTTILSALLEMDISALKGRDAVKIGGDLKSRFAASATIATAFGYPPISFTEKKAWNDAVPANGIGNRWHRFCR